MDYPKLENMKGKRDATTEFRVSLSTEALDILKQARLLSRNDFFFSATGWGLLRRSDPHGLLIRNMQGWRILIDLI